MKILMFLLNAYLCLIEIEPHFEINSLLEAEHQARKVSGQGLHLFIVCLCFAFQGSYRRILDQILAGVKFVLRCCFVFDFLK